MAEVYKGIEKQLARTAVVQAALEAAALERALVAEAALARHEDTGAARIETDRGDVDRYVILSDEAGLGAAMSIEYGRKPSYGDDGEVKNPGMQGLWILHDAFGLPHGGG